MHVHRNSEHVISFHDSPTCSHSELLNQIYRLIYWSLHKTWMNTAFSKSEFFLIYSDHLHKCSQSHFPVTIPSNDSAAWSSHLHQACLAAAFCVSNMFSSPFLRGFYFHQQMCYWATQCVIINKPTALWGIWRLEVEMSIVSWYTCFYTVGLNECAFVSGKKQFEPVTI